MKSWRAPSIGNRREDKERTDPAFWFPDKERSALSHDSIRDAPVRLFLTTIPARGERHGTEKTSLRDAAAQWGYSVRLSDLRAYATEKGVLYFQIFINGQEREIFYSSLYPSRILDYLEKAKKKKNSVSISIPFRKLEKDADKLFMIAKQFNQEALKQGSAYTPLVQDRIRIDNLPNVKEINWSVIGANDPYEALMRLSSGDICLYR